MSDLFVQKSDYFLGLSSQKIVIKNGRREIESEISLHLVDNILIFGKAQIIQVTRRFWSESAAFLF